MSTSANIGVCGWSLDRSDAERSIELASSLGFDSIQLGFFGADAVENANPQRLIDAAHRCRVSVVGCFIAFDGEDYSSIARIAESGGFTPNPSFDERIGLTRRAVGLTRAIGAPSLALHAATIKQDHEFLTSRVRQAADFAAECGLRLLLETGRESADLLLQFIRSVGRANVGINFDPANFLIYGSDDPVSAVVRLRDRIEMVHLKDAKRSLRPGVDYGEPAAIGTGDVQVPRILSKLRAIGYHAPLLLEIDARSDGGEALRAAADYLRSMIG